MNIEIINDNLFSISKEYIILHCISLDCEMGCGVALQIQHLFPNIKNYLKQVIKDKNIKHYPAVILYNKDGFNIFNLITKQYYHSKPSYKSIRTCLCQIAYYCEANNITKIAMPRIGCGYDKLKWDKVYSIIHDVFNNSNIEIKIFI